MNIKTTLQLIKNKKKNPVVGPEILLKSRVEQRRTLSYITCYIFWLLVYIFKKVPIFDFQKSVQFRFSKNNIFACESTELSNLATFSQKCNGKNNNFTEKDYKYFRNNTEQNKNFDVYYCSLVFLITTVISQYEKKPSTKHSKNNRRLFLCINIRFFFFLFTRLTFYAVHSAKNVRVINFPC